jgi:hypothetical protein
MGAASREPGRGEIPMRPEPQAVYAVALKAVRLFMLREVVSNRSIPIIEMKNK